MAEKPYGGYGGWVKTAEEKTNEALNLVAGGEAKLYREFGKRAEHLEAHLENPSKAKAPLETLYGVIATSSRDGSNVTGVTEDPLGYMRYSTPVGTVVLHMPQDISETLESSWEDGTDAIDKLIARGKGASEVFRSGENLTQGAIRSGARAMEKVLGIEDLHKSVLRRQGIAENPHSHQFFSGMSFQSHSFKHKLISFTREDTEMNRAIIEFFKFQIKPSVKDSGRFLTYPNTFRINFMKDKDPNTFLFCVCTNVEVGYTGSGTWSSFRNGAPVDIDLTLQFNELELPYD